MKMPMTIPPETADEIVRLSLLTEALRKSEAALREAQRIGRIGSWEWELDSDIARWSEEQYRIFGCDPNRLPPGYAEHEKMFTPESWQRLTAAVDLAIEQGTPYLLEVQYVRADGYRGWLEARGEAVRDAEGAITGLRGVVREITEKFARCDTAGSLRQPDRSAQLPDVPSSSRSPTSANLSSASSATALMAPEIGHASSRPNRQLELLQAARAVLEVMDVAEQEDSSFVDGWDEAKAALSAAILRHR